MGREIGASRHFHETDAAAVGALCWYALTRDRYVLLRPSLYQSSYDGPTHRSIRQRKYAVECAGIDESRRLRPIPKAPLSILDGWHTRPINSGADIDRSFAFKVYRHSPSWRRRHRGRRFTLSAFRCNTLCCRQESGKVCDDHLAILSEGGDKLRPDLREPIFERASY